MIIGPFFETLLTSADFESFPQNEYNYQYPAQVIKMYSEKCPPCLLPLPGVKGC